jgi:uncharacterized protein YkwD
MKWKTKIALSALSLSLIFPLSPEAAGKFSDVGPRFEDEIEYLASRNVVKGYSNGTFGVNAPVTRGEAVTMIVRELAIRIDGAPDPGFTDFKRGDGFYTEVVHAVKHGIIQGKVASDGTRYFDANGPLSRSEMAIILAGAYDIPLDRYDVGFKDVSSTMPSKPAINSMANGGISFGYEDGTYKPYASITRQEFAAMLARTLNKEFNPMGMEFVHYDEGTHQRVDVDWLTTQELDGMEKELFDIINSVRKNKGFQPLKLNERFQEMAGLKARASARYPYEDHVMQTNFYEVMYGEKLNVEYKERYASGSVESAFRTVSTKSMNVPYAFEAAQKELGIGVAQQMDGTFIWVLNFVYE